MSAGRGNGGFSSIWSDKDLQKALWGAMIHRACLGLPAAQRDKAEGRARGEIRIGSKGDETRENHHHHIYIGTIGITTISALCINWNGINYLSRVFASCCVREIQVMGVLFRLYNVTIVG
jgi:hypothetical protein